MKDRVARGDAEARKLNDAVLTAIADLADHPCAGHRLRGDVILAQLCAYHLTRPFSRWRIVYKLQAPGRTPVLLMLGEHWKPADARPRHRRGSPSRLGQRLRFSDVYDATAGALKLTRQQREVAARAIRTIEEERCCKDAGD